VHDRANRGHGEGHVVRPVPHRLARHASPEIYGPTHGVHVDSRESRPVFPNQPGLHGTGDQGFVPGRAKALTPAARPASAHHGDGVRREPELSHRTRPPERHGLVCPIQCGGAPAWTPSADRLRAEAPGAEPPEDPPICTVAIVRTTRTPPLAFPTGLPFS